MIKKYALIVILALGLAAFWASGLHRWLSLESLSEHRQSLLALASAHRLAALPAYIFIYATATAFSIPGGIFLTLAGGFVFGAALGGTLTVIGATLGATGVFLAARTAFGDTLKEKAGPRLKKLQEGFAGNALSYLLFLRLVPLFPFWLVNIAPAFLNVNLRIYIIGTFLGIIPGTFVYAAVGNGLGAVLDAGSKPELGIIFKPEILFPVAGLAMLSLIPVFYKKVKNRNEKI